MRFRKTLTLLMLAMGLVFVLPAWAQQKPFTRQQVQGLARASSQSEPGRSAPLRSAPLLSAALPRLMAQIMTERGGFK
jgi:hypothetical protein